MNSYARGYSSNDPAMKMWIGRMRPRDKAVLYGSVLIALGAYIGVYYTEEIEKNRRHKSIEKDIERERWRARELGLAAPSDDGFADTYLARVQRSDTEHAKTQQMKSRGMHSE